MKHPGKRALTWLLAACMVISMLPAGAFAAQAAEPQSAALPATLETAEYTVSAAEWPAGEEQPGDITIRIANIYTEHPSRGTPYLRLEFSVPEGEWRYKVSFNSGDSTATAYPSNGVCTTLYTPSGYTLGSYTFTADITARGGEIVYETATLTTYIATQEEFPVSQEDLAGSMVEYFHVDDEYFHVSFPLAPNSPVLEYDRSEVTVKLAAHGDSSDIYAVSLSNNTPYWYSNRMADPRYEGLFRDSNYSYYHYADYYYAYCSLRMGKPLPAGTYDVLVCDKATGELLCTCASAVQVTKQPVVSYSGYTYKYAGNKVGSSTAYIQLYASGADPEDFTVKLYDSNGTLIGTSTQFRHTSSPSNGFEGIYYIPLTDGAVLETYQDYSIEVTCALGDYFLSDSDPTLWLYEGSLNTLEPTFSNHYYAEALLQIIGASEDSLYKFELYDPNGDLLSTVSACPDSDDLFVLEFLDSDGGLIPLEPYGSYEVRVYDSEDQEFGSTWLYNEFVDTYGMVTLAAEEELTVDARNAWFSIECDTVDAYLSLYTTDANYAALTSAADKFCLRMTSVLGTVYDIPLTLTSSNVSSSGKYNRMYFSATVPAAVPKGYYFYELYHNGVSLVDEDGKNLVYNRYPGLYGAAPSLYNYFDQWLGLSFVCSFGTNNVADPAAHTYRTEFYKLGNNTATPDYTITWPSGSYFELTDEHMANLDPTAMYEIVSYIDSEATDHSYYYMHPISAATLNALWEQEDSGAIPTVTVTPGAVSNGTLEIVSPFTGTSSTVPQYSEVYVKATPAEGYRLLPGSVKVNGQSIPSRAFLAVENATVTAAFVPETMVSYTVSLPDYVDYGSITPQKAKYFEGETVTVTLTPDEGYKASSAYYTLSSDGSTTSMTDNGDGTWSFTMPACSVTVNATFHPLTASQIQSGSIDASIITAQFSDENGSIITPDSTEVTEGTQVTVTIDVAVGYQLGNVYYYSFYDGMYYYPALVAGTENQYTFIMPGSAIQFYADYTADAARTVSIAGCDFGSVTTDTASAYSGQTVTVTPCPDEGYRTLSVFYLDSSGTPHDIAADASGVYSFIMPADDVTVCGDFELIPTDSGTCGDNLFWELDADGVLTISGTGAMGEYTYYSDYPWHSLRGSIVTLVIKEGVTTISKSAFRDCEALTSATLPSTLTSLSDYTFEGCDLLASVNIPDGITAIGIRAFYSCDALTEIVLPEGITVIDIEAFYLCSGLASINLPNGLTTIGEAAFSRCRSLTSIDLPDSLTTLDAEAFSGCVGLTEVTIPAKITSISDKLFNGCTQLAKVTLHEGVTSIGNNAFDSSGLTAIDLPDSVTSIGSKAFYRCSNLTEITIPAGVTAIDTSTFYGCRNLFDLILPASVTSIGDSAFESCPNLTYVHYAGSEEQWAAITTGTNNTPLENAAVHYKCDGSDAAGYNFTWSLSDGTLTISGTGAMPNYSDAAPWFDSRASITKVVIGSGITTIGDKSFSGCGALTEVSIPDTVTFIGDSAFANCGALTGITIPAKVTSIGNSAFFNCKSLTSFVIPNSVTSVGKYAFQYCSALTTVTVGSGVTVFDTETFYNCTSLTKIILPEGFTTIGNYVFYGCKALQWIAIPDSVTSIGSKSFTSCTALTDVYYGGSEEQWAAITVSSGNDCLTGATIHYNTQAPVAVIASGTCGDNLTWELTDNGKLTISGTGAMPDSYAPWYEYYESLTKVVIEDGVTAIGKLAFYKCSNLASISIPDSVTSIGAYAFGNCFALTEITIPGSVTSIDAYAFGYCSALTEITIPDSVTSIGEGAFGYTSLTGIVIPEGVTAIGAQTFYGCSALTEVTIPKSVTSIGEAAFKYCTALTEVTIPGSVTSVGNYAFDGCSSLADLTISEGVTYLGDAAFRGCTSLNSVTIPNSVTSTGQAVFVQCSALTHVTLGSGLAAINGHVFNSCTALESITIPSTVTSIGAYAFSGSGLAELNLPGSIATLGEGAFFKCSALTEVTVPAGITSIGTGVFANCTGLTKATIASGVASINSYMFGNCAALTTVALPDSIISIGEYAFSGCTALERVYYAGSETQWNAITIDADNDCLTAASIYYNSTGPIASGTCGSDLNWTLTGDGTLIISSATDAGWMTDYGASDDDAFGLAPWYGYRASITEVVIENGVKGIIGSYSFYGCTALKSVSIPASITGISHRAFLDCAKLETFTVDTASTCFSTDEHGVLFFTENGVKTELVRYPSGSNLTSYVIPNGVMNIAPYAFQNSTNLTGVTIPDGVLCIMDHAFADCTALKSVTIPDSVTFINSYAFFGCTALEDLTLPNGVESLGEYAFSGCTALKRVVIPESVRMVNMGVFSGCTALTGVCFYTRPELVEPSAFDAGTVTLYYIEDTGWEGWADWNGITWNGIPVAVWGRRVIAPMMNATVTFSEDSFTVSGEMYTTGMDMTVYCAVYGTDGRMLGVKLKDFKDADTDRSMNWTMSRTDRDSCLKFFVTESSNKAPWGPSSKETPLK